jgi:uncharacterized membrane protein YphA (DoxX/SURF4 family)
MPEAATPTPATLGSRALTGARDAFWILRTGYAAMPILVGLDKIVHVLGVGHWDRYLWPALPEALGIEPDTFMHAVGVIEVVAGILVAARPRWGAWLVVAWLLGIVANLLLLGEYLDVAVRDVGLVLGAVALARLAADGRAGGATAPV